MLCQIPNLSLLGFTFAYCFCANPPSPWPENTRTEMALDTSWRLGGKTLPLGWQRAFPMWTGLATSTSTTAWLPTVPLRWRSRPLTAKVKVLSARSPWSTPQRKVSHREVQRGWAPVLAVATRGRPRLYLSQLTHESRNVALNLPLTPHRAHSRTSEHQRHGTDRFWDPGVVGSGAAAQRQRHPQRIRGWSNKADWKNVRGLKLEVIKNKYNAKNNITGRKESSQYSSPSASMIILRIKLHLKVPYYAKLALPMFANNIMCL